MPKIILSEFVEPELAAIWEFIAADNIDAADRLLAAAEDTFEVLARMPDMGSPRTFKPVRLRKLRSFRVKGFENYLIFYIPLRDGIEVLHILHGARELEGFWQSE